MLGVVCLDFTKHCFPAWDGQGRRVFLVPWNSYYSMLIVIFYIVQSSKIRHPPTQQYIYTIFLIVSYISQLLIIPFQLLLIFMIPSNLMRNLYLFSKICRTSDEAIDGLKDNSLLLVGGFGICGVPMCLINAVRQSGVQGLTVVSNNCGFMQKNGEKIWGLAVLLQSRQIRRMVSSYVGQNPLFEKQYLSGELELQICPQGTLAQRIRSGGCGIPAFYTATGVGTILQTGGFPIKFKPGTPQPQIIAQPKPTSVFQGKKYLQEETIYGDYALIKAHKADKLGNLTFRKTARNFNADMATAAKTVIAQVEEIVQNGELDPESIHVPSLYVDRIYKSDPKDPMSKKEVQKITTISHQSKELSAAELLRIKIIKRAAKEVTDGMNVNLGIGIPTLLPSVLPSSIRINLQSQNGVFGVGPYPHPSDVDPDLINAGKETITLLPGGSYFSSSQSFGIIRGGHLDLTMLGALQVSEEGDIANWIIPGKLLKGMGGAMDLVACGSKVIVVMEHMAKQSKKLLSHCSLPLTAKGTVNMVITEMAVFENINGKLVMTEIAEGLTLQEVQKATEFPITCSDSLKTF